jgi:hypothetical protein
LFITVIAFFPDSPLRIILGVPFILFFPGYVLICAIFPRKDVLDWFERLGLSFGFSMAVTALMGFVLNYTLSGIRLYTVIFSQLLFILVISAAVIYSRRIIFPGDVFAPFVSASISRWRELERVKNEFIRFNEGCKKSKIVAIIAFSFITMAIIILTNSPATCYEASIYTATPILAWFFLVGGLAGGIGIAVYEVYQKNENRNKLWGLGFLLIMLFSLTLLGLPHIRGYLFYGAGDIFTHMKYSQEILLNGHFGWNNIYPIMHIFTVQCYHVLGIKLIVLYRVIPLGFYILYAVFMYLFARTLLPSRGYAIMAALAGLAILRGSIYIYPSGLTTLLIPLVLYLFCKCNNPREKRFKVQFTILFVIMLFLFPISHPIPAIVLILLLLAIWLSAKVSVLKSTSLAVSSENGYKVNSTVFLLLIVWFISWLSSFGAWGRAIRNFHLLLTEGATTTVDAMRAQMVYAEGYGYSVLDQFFKSYTTTLVYTVLTLVAFFILIKRRKEDTKLENLFAFYPPLIALAIAVLAGLFSNVSGLTRILGMGFIFCSPFVGFLLYEVLERKSHGNFWRKACPCSIIALLLMVSISGMLLTYPSPYLLRPNDQVTHTELQGMDWFFHSKDVTTPFFSKLIVPYRYADMLLTQEECAGRKDIIYFPIPYHFGYHENDSLGDLTKYDKYIVLKTVDRVVYREVWTKVEEERFLPGDYEQLENDVCVEKLYSNGGFDAYFIHGRGT